MTILAYQTLYESSIAYGMRKAMQAEQSMAEKLNKLASLQQIIYDQEQEIMAQKQTIMQKLDEESDDKIESENSHKEKTMAYTEANQSKVAELKALLLKINGL